MATPVPSQYLPYVQEAAQGTGLPASVVAAQANAESGFNSSAVSPTGAEGWLQFEPGTYNSVAGAAGVPANSEFNVADETKAYIVYMNELLNQEGGNVYAALEAYNAGPGNLSAGSSYASGILSNAGVSQAQTVSATGVLPSLGQLLNPFGNLNLGGVGSPSNSITSGAAADVVTGAINSILKSLGIPTLTDLFQRLGLILLGAVLVLVGLNMLVKVSYAGFSVGGGNASYSKGGVKVSNALQY
jgi:hypothetical protein